MKLMKLMKLNNRLILKKIYIIILILFYLIICNLYNNKEFICLCVIGKKENLYAKEYVNYYINLGYDHIYIYDNNDIEDENFESVIEDEIKRGYVSIINFRGYRSVQLEAYIHCYENYNKKYKWLSFFDFDEFLELKSKNMTIKQFLNNETFYKCITVKINWVMYTDNNLVNYENKFLNERFTLAKYDDSSNVHVKSIVRGNLNVNYWKNAPNPHSSNFGFPSCSSTGKKILNTSPFNDPPDFGGAILKHYHTKTIEEFIWKIKRGPSETTNDIPKSYFKIKLNRFFLMNNKTKQKLDLIKTRLNISIDI